jgi:hypothetical protein
VLCVPRSAVQVNDDRPERGGAELVALHAPSPAVLLCADSRALTFVCAICDCR